MDINYGYKFKVFYNENVDHQADIGLVFAYDYKEAIAKVQEYYRGMGVTEIQIRATSIEDMIIVSRENEGILDALIKTNKP